MRHAFGAGTSLLINELGTAPLADVSVTNFTWHCYLLFQVFDLGFLGELPWSPNTYDTLY